MFTIIFVIEMLWKLIAFGPLTYIKSRWNVFDAVIVIASVAGYLTASGGSFSIFRSLRLVINLVSPTASKSRPYDCQKEWFDFVCYSLTNDRPVC